jgi:hypothetical protein
VRKPDGGRMEPITHHHKEIPLTLTTMHFTYQADIYENTGTVSDSLSKSTTKQLFALFSRSPFFYLFL